jgi:hypothetical protein
MGIFDGIEKAEYFEGGKYVSPGLYLAKIDKVKQAMTRKKRPFFVVEMTVLETSNPKDHPVNDGMSWMVMLDQDAALGNVKHFISVASDTPLDQVQASDAEDACGEDNPLSGVTLRISATNIKTKADKDFTKCRFMSAAMDATAAAKEHANEAASGSAPAPAAAAAAPATA